VPTYTSLLLQDLNIRPLHPAAFIMMIVTVINVELQQIQLTCGQMPNAKSHNKYGMQNPKDNRACYMVVW